MAVATGTALLAGSALAGAGAIAGGAMSSSAAKSAANTQAEAANRASQLQYDMFQQQMGLQEPFRQAGLSGQNRLLDLLGLSGNTGATGYGSAMVPFSQTDFTADPGYAFRLSEGMKALEGSAAARGLLKSGGTIAGGQQYAQGLASQEYQNAFNRYYDERNAMINPLEALRGSAQTAATSMGGAASQYGANVGNLMLGAADARAAGRIGSANAFSNALGQGASIFGNYLAQPSTGGGFNPYAAMGGANAGMNSMPSYNATFDGLSLPSGYVG
jgi:hypothetical protein